jgi:hypothetical protein
MPEDDRQWVIDAAKTMPGVRDAYHPLDAKTGNGLSIAFFDDDVDVARTRAVCTASSSRSVGGCPRKFCTGHRRTKKGCLPTPGV